MDTLRFAQNEQNQEAIYLLLRLIVDYTLNQLELPDDSNQQVLHELKQIILEEGKEHQSRKQRLLNILANLKATKKPIEGVNEPQRKLNLVFNAFIEKLPQAWQTLRADVLLSNFFFNAEEKKQIGTLIQENHITTFDILQEFVLYDGIKTKAFKVFTSLASELDRNNPQHPVATEFDIQLQIRNDFILPLLDCKTKADYKQFIINKTRLLFSKDSNESKPIYQDPYIKKTIINCLTEIYLVLSDNSNGSDTESNFDETEKLEIRQVINEFFNQELYNQLKKNNTRFILELAKNNVSHAKFLEELDATLEASFKLGNYESYVTVIYGYLLDPTTNAKIKQNLSHQHHLILQWFKQGHTFLEGNPIVGARLSFLNEYAAKTLNEYKHNRENALIYKITDAYYRFAPNRKEGKNARINAANAALTSLPKANQPKEYIAFTKMLGDKIQTIENNSSHLKKLFRRLQEFTADELSQINSYDDAAEHVCENANDRFNDRIAEAFEKYRTNRGATGLLKSVFTIGVFKTFRELILGSKTQRDQRLAVAYYFQNQIKQCKTAEDYTNFIIDSSSIIKTLTKKGELDSQLRRMLIISRMLLINRFLFHKRLPEFTLEQKISISLAESFGTKKQTPVFAKLQVQIQKEFTDKEQYVKAYDEQKQKFATLIKHSKAKINSYLAFYDKHQDEKKAEMFRTSLVDLLTRRFLASKVISSGQVAGKPGTEGMIGDVLRTLAKQVGSVPGADVALNVGAAALEFDDKQKRTQEHNNIAVAFQDLKDVQELIDLVAKKLAFRYIDQVQNVHFDEINQLATYAVERIIMFVASGKLQKGDLTNRSDQLVQAVSNHELRHSFIPFMKRSIGHKDSKVNWDVEDLFALPGIAVIHGDSITYYAKNRNETPKYGYMIGTEEEAKHFGMVKVEGSSLPAHPALQVKDKPVAKMVDIEIDLNKEIQDTKNRVEKLETDVVHLRRENSELKTELESVRHGHSSMQEKLALLERNAREDKQVIAALTSQMAELLGEVRTFRQELRNSQSTSSLTLTTAV